MKPITPAEMVGFARALPTLQSNCYYSNHGNAQLGGRFHETCQVDIYTLPRTRINHRSIRSRPDLEEIVPAFGNSDCGTSHTAADRQADDHRLPLRNFVPWSQVEQLD